MNIKKKKIILNDEVKEFLNIMEKENNENKLVKNNYEKKVNKQVKIIIIFLYIDFLKIIILFLSFRNLQNL